MRRKLLNTWRDYRLEQFDRGMAIEMIEDSLEALDDPIGRGIALGLCSAFYLVGVIKPADWEKYEKHILESAFVTDCHYRPASRARSPGGIRPPATGRRSNTPTG